jgi:hypothetical protein
MFTLFFTLLTIFLSSIVKCELDSMVLPESFDVEITSLSSSDSETATPEGFVDGCSSSVLAILAMTFSILLNIFFCCGVAIVYFAFRQYISWQFMLNTMCCGLCWCLEIPRGERNPVARADVASTSRLRTVGDEVVELEAVIVHNSPLRTELVVTE